MTSTTTKEFKLVDMIDFPTRGRSVFIRATVAELRGDRIICRNKSGYYYSVGPGEVYVRPKVKWIRKGRKYVCEDCRHKEKRPNRFCGWCGAEMEGEE